MSTYSKMSEEQLITLIRGGGVSSYGLAVAASVITEALREKTTRCDGDIR